MAFINRVDRGGGVRPLRRNYRGSGCYDLLGVRSVVRTGEQHHGDSPLAHGEPVIGPRAKLVDHACGVHAGHERRCAEQSIPPERAAAVATKPELARRMLERALGAGVPFGYLLADEAYGQCRAPRAWLEEPPAVLRARGPQNRGPAAAGRSHPAGPRTAGTRSRGGVRAPLVRRRRQWAVRVRLGHRPTRHRNRGLRATLADPSLHRAQQE
ncbi:transposase [Streptomyces scopuliridis]|uniref:transposase n=1 Tax=Streptomyces scopuliridis TaxID=452529 RepID=UPI0036CAAF54